MTLPFLEKILRELSQGDFTATYKYAVLLGVIDLCVEHGSPPDSVTTVQLSRRVVELYWPQVRGYSGTQAVLRQNSRGLATIARLIAKYRREHPDLTSPPGLYGPGGYAELLDEIEWVL